MISGIVTEGHAIVTVGFRIPNRSDIPIDFVVDTGFTDELCLPLEAVTLLGLRFKYAIPANLADNSRVTLPVHEAIIVWNGEEREAVSWLQDEDRYLELLCWMGMNLSCNSQRAGW